MTESHALRQAQGLKPSTKAPQGLDVTRLKQARRLFCHPLAPRHTQRHNIRQWGEKPAAAWLQVAAGKELMQARSGLLLRDNKPA